MKRSAPPAGMQWNLPLIDTPALAVPEQQKLALALMELLIQVARQTSTAASRLPQEAPHGCKANF
jgi:hypothetical protein